MESLRSRLGRAGPNLFPAAVLLLCFAPVYLTTYAFLDDYAAFVDTRTWAGAKMLMSAMVTDGGPVYGVLVAAAFGWTNGIEDLALIRLWTVGWIILSAIAITRLLCRRGYDRWLAASFATSWALLPSIQVFVSWAQVGAGQAPAVFLAFLASAFLDPAGGGAPQRRKVACAILIHAVAVCMHQSAAMTFWAFVMLRLIAWPGGSEAPEGANRGLYRRALVTGITAMALGFAVVKLAPWFGFSRSERGALLDDPVGKIQWFFTEPLPRAVQVFTLSRSGVVAGLCALGFLVGALRIHRLSGRTLGSQWKPVAAGGVLVALCYAPNLVVAQDWPSYRSLVALSSCWLFLALPVVGTVWGLGGRSKTAARVAAILLVSALAIKARSQCVSLFVAPQVIERQLITQQVREAVDAGVMVLVGRCAAPEDRIAPFTIGDEFGARSSLPAWGLHYQILTALIEIGKPTEKYGIETRPATTTDAGVHVDGRRTSPDSGGR